MNKVLDGYVEYFTDRVKVYHDPDGPGYGTYVVNVNGVEFETKHVARLRDGGTTIITVTDPYGDDLEVVLPAPMRKKYHDEKPSINKHPIIEYG